MAETRTARLIVLEQALHSSAVRRDPVATAALLSEEFREFGASGRVWSRAEILAALSVETSEPVHSEAFACMHLSETLSLLTYQAHKGSRTTLRSSLWRLESGQWRMLFHQGTPVPPQQT